MSIGDLEPDGIFLTPIQGEGFSVSYEPCDGLTKVRADVWDGAIHKVCPKLTMWPVPSIIKAEMIERLHYDLPEQAERLAVAWDAAVG